MKEETTSRLEQSLRELNNNDDATKVKETDRALRLADHYPLSPKDERDVRIVVCINNGMTRVMDVDLELDRFGIEPLCGD